jgi:hypothetical protein
VAEGIFTPDPLLAKQRWHYAEFLPVGLDTIYIVPTMASIKIGTLKSQVYGARKIEMSVNAHIETNDMIFALNGIAPVLKYSPTCRPNRRLLITKL